MLPVPESGIANTLLNAVEKRTLLLLQRDDGRFAGFLGSAFKSHSKQKTRKKKSNDA
jgi:hypothetical protein